MYRSLSHHDDLKSTMTIIRFSACFVYGSLFAVPYVRFVISPRSPGRSRALVSLPLCAAFLSAPLLFNLQTEILERLVIMFVFSWLGTFKVLALCLCRGPLVGTWTVMQTIPILLLPIYPLPTSLDHSAPAGRLKDDAGSPMTLLLRWIAKIAVLGAILPILMGKYNLDPFMQSFVLSLGLYCFVGALMDGPGSAATGLLGFKLIPTFDQPWLSCSISDFWGRRWNITTSHMLRALIYDPIVEGCWVKRSHATSKPMRSDNTSRTLRNYAGLLCTFFVSGIVHEAIFWCIQPDGIWRWKWLVYFTIQAPMMMAEQGLKRWVRQQGGEMPGPWVMRPLVVSFMLWVGQRLFFAPAVTETDTADRVLQACQLIYHQSLICINKAAEGFKLIGKSATY